MVSRTRIAYLGSFLALSALTLYFTNRILSFKNLFYNHSGIPLSQSAIVKSYETDHSEKKAVVPRLIHQIFHNWTDPSNEALPVHWEEARQTCLDFNEGWEYRLWTAPKSREFIEKEYPWFLKTYDGYSRPVQRVDALKYFLLRHYGGIYIDLDDACISSLEALRYYPVWVTDGDRGCLSNNILGAEPNHPFWKKVTESLRRYAWNYPLPYLTVHYGSGQWFETAIWEEYHHSKGHQDLVRVIMDDRPEAEEWLFFRHTPTGGTWDGWDNQLMRWIGDNVLLTVIIGFSAGIAAAYVMWRTLRFGLALLTTPKQRYSKLPS